MKIDAVVLAGGDAQKVDASFEGPKSLINIAGQPMIEYVLEALRQSSSLDRIAIALPADTDKSVFKNITGQIIPDTHGVIDAMSKAVEAFGDEGYLMAVSSDIPMINAEVIDAFIKKCEEKPGDIYYTIIPKDVMEDAYPGSKRTYFRVYEGAFTGGNVHMIKKTTFVENSGLAEQIFSMRKSPLSLIRLLGVTFLIKFALGRLKIGSVEDKAGKAFSAKVRTVTMLHPELGVDVDKPEDLALAESHLGKKSIT